jgi:hypothetical protein
VARLFLRAAHVEDLPGPKAHDGGLHPAPSKTAAFQD